MNFARLLVQKELANGLRSCVLPLSRNLVELRCLIHTGSIHEGPDLGRGVSHLVEHMVFRGARGYPGNTVSEVFAQMGGCELNAVTSCEYTMYQAAIPQEHLAKAVHAICAMVRYPEFNAEAFAAEREAILREADRGMDRPEFRLYWKNSSLFFPSHPLRHPVIGYPELIRSTTAEHLRAYHARRYAPNRCCWVAAGPVEPERFFALVEENFGDWPRNMAEAPAFPPALPPASPLHGELIFPDAVERVTVCARQPRAVMENPGHVALISGLTATLLNRELVQKRQLAHQIAPVSGGIREAAFQGICGVCTPGHLLQLERAVSRALTDFSNGKFSAADFLREKRVIRSLCMAASEQTGELAQAIAMAMLHSDDAAIAFDDPYAAITPETFREAVSGMFQPRHLVVCRQWSRAPRGGKNLSRITPPEPQELRLPSGVTAILLPKPDRELCTLQLSWCDGAVTDPEEKKGLNTLTTEVLTCGTRKLSEEAIDKKLDQYGASLDVRSAMTRTDLELTAPRTSFGKVLDFLHDVLTEATFPESAVSREKKILQEKIATARLKPMGAGMRAAFQTFYGKQPQGRSRFGEPEGIAAITAEDLRQNYRRWWHRGTFRAGFAGAVTPEDAEKWLSRLLNGIDWQPEPLTLPPRAVLPEREQCVTVRADREQALSLIMLPGPWLPGSPDYGAWKVLAAAENGLSSQLFHSVRDNNALAYDTGFFASGGYLYPGELSFYALTAPETVEQAETLIRQEIVRLRDRGLAKEEFQRAKTCAIFSLLAQGDHPSDQLSDLILLSVCGRPIGELAELPEAIRKLTLRQMNRVLASNLDLHRSVRVRAGRF